MSLVRTGILCCCVVVITISIIFHGQMRPPSVPDLVAGRGRRVHEDRTGVGFVIEPPGSVALRRTLDVDGGHPAGMGVTKIIVWPQ